MPDLGDLEHEMRALDRPGHPDGRSSPEHDRAVAALATRQHGVVARRQLVKLGLGRGAIQHRLTSGRLHPLHRGIYAVGHPVLTARGHYMAAVLTRGAGAVLSHQAAAALWELRPSARSKVDVTAPGRNQTSVPGIELHRPRGLHPGDRTQHHGIPVTTVARTLLDLAEVVDCRQLERAFETVERLRLLDLGAIERLLSRSPGRRGLRPLTALLAQHTAPTPPTRSELERRFLDLCRDAGLPPPAVNVIVAGLEVDAAWLKQRLVVELDGHAFHRTRAAFERDRVRDAALQLAGYIASETLRCSSRATASFASPTGGSRPSLVRSQN